MKFLLEPAQRARRLLKLYPSTWRERYGDEFLDFMEQSIASDPHNTRRTSNIIYKSAKVRLSDLGISGHDLDEARGPKISLGTTTFLASIFAVFALFYWSTAMISWNSNPRVETSFGVSLWMGAITVSAILLSLSLLTIGITLIARAWRKAVRERDRRLFILLFLVLASVATIVNSSYQYTHWTWSRGGIQWMGAGTVLKQFAGNTQWIAQSTIWGPSWTGWHFFSNDGPIRYGTPLAVIVLVVSVAKIARRLDFSPNANRAARVAMDLLAFAMIAFLLSFAGWSLAGGFKNSWVRDFTQMQKSLFLVITFVAVLTLVIALRSRVPRNTINVTGTTVIGVAGLLFVGGVVWQSLGTTSPSDRQDAYVVINPLSGQVVAVGPRTSVVMNPMTGQIVKISGPKT